MGSRLVLVVAISCTLVAAYQWACREGAFGAAVSTVGEEKWEGRAGGDRGSRCYPLAGLVGLTARKHSCLGPPGVKSAPPMCSARPSWSPRSQLARLKKRPAIQVRNMPARAVSRMSHPYINDPKYWRERAEEARSIAKLLN